VQVREWVGAYADASRTGAEEDRKRGQEVQVTVTEFETPPGPFAPAPLRSSG